MTKNIQENIDYTLSTFAIEGLKPSEAAIELCRKNAEGDISLKSAIEEIKRKYKINRKLGELICMRENDLYKAEKQKQISELRSKAAIAEKSRLFGEPTISLNEARKRIEKKYAEME